MRSIRKLIAMHHPESYIKDLIKITTEFPYIASSNPGDQYDDSYELFLDRSNVINKTYKT